MCPAVFMLSTTYKRKLSSIQKSACMLSVNEHGIYNEASRPTLAYVWSIRKHGINKDSKYNSIMKPTIHTEMTAWADHKNI